MKAKEAVEIALGFLGYKSNDISTVKKISAVNCIYSEIYHLEAENIEEFENIKNLETELKISNYAMNNCIAYGIASMIALSEQDNDQQNFYTEIYNQRLRGLPKRKSVRIDVGPHIEGV